MLLTAFYAARYRPCLFINVKPTKKSQIEISKLYARETSTLNQAISHPKIEMMAIQCTENKVTLRLKYKDMLS